jgi:hypothetical protein
LKSGDGDGLVVQHGDVSRCGLRTGLARGVLFEHILQVDHFHFAV